MQEMLGSQSGFRQKNTILKTLKPYKIRPNVIYLKDSRDKILLMTEKFGPTEIPECEKGYWGGFSPKRKGKYVD